MADMLTDFDFDDPIPAISTKKRKNVIGLDDLFKDYKKDQEQSKKKQLKAGKALKNWELDDDDAVETETKLTETFHKFQQTMKEVDGQEIELLEHHQKDISLSWGLQVFGVQNTSSPCLVTDLGSSLLSQNLLNDEVSALLEPTPRTGATFLRGLLLNGWLSKLILHHGYLEESVAKWTLNLLLYSSEESLMTSACDFWCDILGCDKVITSMVKIEWFPGFVELQRALQSFGFQLYSPSNISRNVQSSEKSEQESSKSTGPHLKGPPANIRAWIKFASACCRVRSRYLIFSTLEAQELVATTVCLFLDRNLLGLTSELHECLLLAVNYFEEKEWCSNCEKVTKTITERVPCDLNCLRAVECISGVDTRSKQLRSGLASEMLRHCFTELTDVKDILKFMLSNNLKDKDCNLSKIYIYFVLIENWLLFSAETGAIMKEMWNGIIRKCSSQICNTDFRPCAQEIRNRASYLLQNTSNE